MVNAARPRLAMVTFATLLSLGCGEYAHRNPLDPDADTHIMILGPDTLWALGETGQYTATVSPAMPSGADVVWGPLAGSGAPVDVLFPIGQGRYQGFKLGEGSVVAIVGRHEVVKRVVVRQRGAQVYFACPSGGVGGCPSYWMGAVGSTRPLSVAQYDAMSNALGPGQERVAVTYTSRDPTIVDIVPGTASPTGVTIRAVANGSTYVRAQLGTWADSILVSVSP